MMDMAIPVGFAVGLLTGCGFTAIIGISLIGKSGREFIKYKMKRNTGAKLFAVYESTGNTYLECAKKETPEHPYYTLKNGVIAADPAMFETAKPARFEKGVEIYTCSPQTPIVIDAMSSLYLNTMVPTCRKKHPELNFLSDVELTTLIFTTDTDLIYDCDNYPITISDEEGGIDEDALIAAILDCKSICTSLTIIPRGEIVNGNSASDFMQESEEIIRDDPEPKKGLRGIIRNLFHPAKKIIIRKIGTAKYPPQMYYWNHAYAYEVMPYSHDTVIIKKIIDRMHALYAKMSKTTFRDIMPYGVLMVLGAVAIAIVYIVVSSGGAA